MKIKELGWNDFFNKSFSEIETKETFPARVAEVHKDHYVLFSDEGELRAEVSGKFRYNAITASDYPVVGDWVISRMKPEGGAAIIEGVLPRNSKFSRKVAGTKTDEQVLIANIDIVFLVTGLDNDYSLRRIERYLTIVWDSNVKPVIVLNKTDLCPELKERIAEVKAISSGVPIHALSALKPGGVKGFRKYIKKGCTTALLGSSGVGKSTIINSLLGEERQKVGPVKEGDDTGRHITSYRELIFLPGGGMIIDNPGMRELQMWTGEDSLDETFNDIKEFAYNCKFKDCKHMEEPGCAVKEALEKGELEEKRFQVYLKLKKELNYLATRKEIKSRNKRGIFKKQIAKWQKQVKTIKRNYK